MASDGERYYDFNDNGIQDERNRHSPPALDEHHSVGSPHRRPPNLYLPRQGSVDYDRYKQILGNTKDSDTINNIPYHIWTEVIESLNSEKDNRSDWRGVASRMGVKTTTIEKIEKNHKDDPTRQVLKELSANKTKELLQVLIQMNRHDVLNIFYDNMCTSQGARLKRDTYQDTRLKNPSQESTPVSSESLTSEQLSYTPNTPRSPFKDSGTPESADSGRGSTRSQPPSQSRQKSGSFAQQNTDDDLARRLKTSLNFHSKESHQFWQKIPPNADAATKEWRAFEEQLKKDFRKESMQSQVMRLFCYVLKIEPYEERHSKYVSARDFANLVAWFGPMKSGPEGCFSKIAHLTQHSTTYKGNTGPHSFFAGYMTKEDADRVIAEQEQVGSFLIRFSATYAEQGSFVVVLKTDHGSEHVHLEGNPDTGKLRYDGKEYNDIVTLWRGSLCTGGVSSDGRTSCTTICPNLPLNSMFKPYGAGPGQVPSLGRGRGRGRGQQN